MNLSLLPVPTSVDPVSAGSSVEAAEPGFASALATAAASTTRSTSGDVPTAETPTDTTETASAGTEDLLAWLQATAAATPVPAALDTTTEVVTAMDPLEIPPVAMAPDVTGPDLAAEPGVTPTAVPTPTGEVLRLPEGDMVRPDTSVAADVTPVVTDPTPRSQSYVAPAGLATDSVGPTPASSPAAVLEADASSPLGQMQTDPEPDPAIPASVTVTGTPATETESPTSTARTPDQSASPTTTVGTPGDIRVSAENATDPPDSLEGADALTGLPASQSTTRTPRAASVQPGPVADRPTATDPTAVSEPGTADAVSTGPDPVTMTDRALVEPSTLQRVEAALEQLDHAPPPRTLVLDVADQGGMRIRLTSTADGVQVDIQSNGGQQQDGAWEDDLRRSLAGRGFDLGGRRQPEDHDDPDSLPGTAAASPASPRRAAVDDGLRI